MTEEALIQIEGIRVKNLHFYKEAEFKFDKPGLYVIRGNNKDAAIADSTNGCGKSLFFSSLPEVILNEAVNGKNAKVKAGSTIEQTLDFRIGKDQYSATKFSGKSNSYSLTKNGKDLETRGIEYTRDRIEKLLRHNEEEIYSLDYLDATVPHPLIVGRTVIRQAYFVNLFRLHSSDNIKKILLSELREAQSAKSALKEVKSSYGSIKARCTLTPDELVDAVARLEEVRSTQKKINKRFEQIQYIRDTVTFAKLYSPLIVKFEALTSVATFESDYKNLRVEKRELTRARDQAQAYEAYRSRKKKYLEVSAPLIQELTDLGFGIEDSEVEEAERRNEEYRTAKNKVLQLEDELRELEKELEDIVDVSEVEAPTTDYKEVLSRLDRLEMQLLHANKFKTGECLTCGQPVKVLDIEGLQSKIDKYKQVLKDHKRYDRYLESKKARERGVLALKTVQNNLENHSKNARKLTKFSKACTLYRKLGQAPEKVEKPEYSVEETNTLLEALDTKLETFVATEPLLDKIKEAQALTEEDRLKVKSFDKVVASLNELNSQVSDLQSSIVLNQEFHKQMRELKTRGKQLEVKAKDEPILKALVNAYSSNGIKKLMIQRYAQILEEQVNKFRKILFSEDYTFEFRYGTQFDILVHRQYGKVVKTSDVRKLSGAEKRMFGFLLLVATMTLMPKSRRWNILILDEPTANLGPEMKRAFARFLPVLNKVVPQIVVITPDSTEQYEGASYFVAEKSRGVSQLIKQGEVK